MNTSPSRPALMARLLLGAAVLVSIAPLLLVLLNAFKSHAAIVQNPLSLPTSLALAHFQAAWTGGNFSVGIINSVLLTGTTVLVTVTFAALAAFPLARRRIAIWKAVTIYFLCSVTVPIQLFLFPLYFVFARLGLIGNVFATAFIIAAINLPLAVMLLRTYILTIPVELDDAAYIDGATPWQIFRHVIMPLMRPGCVTVGVIVALNTWNEFLITSTFQQGDAGFTMTLGYRAMAGAMNADRGIMMAGACIVIVPIIVFFLFLQRLFVDGMTAGAVKG
ncbi:MAG: raffinose/stachyose/melibiose transport system permease protein [Gammaproteobacteria bacterium]|jgi:raffinose/stachyose/melibiose transport system permease protein|nr:raffinose/stachyose/melibiose transport system permease protein [Gammaproteobacteria bacterium]